MMKKNIAILLCLILPTITTFGATNASTTVVVKNPTYQGATPASPSNRTSISVTKTKPQPQPGRTQYQVQRPKQKPPLIAGQWTCFSYDASGERWYSINGHRKHALKKARKSCKRNSHTPHSCHTDSAFCVFGGQLHVQKKTVFY